MSEQHGSGRDEQRGSFFSSRGRIVLIGFLLIAGYFLVTEHAAHLALAVPYLPFLLLAACPLLHLFMHGGHKHNHDQNASGNHRMPNDGGTAP